MASKHRVDKHSAITDAASDRIAEMYQRHGAAILRYMRRRLGDGPAEDAAADVFARALSGLASYRPRGESSDLPWLYGIAARVIADSHRAEKRRLRMLEQLAGREVGEDAALATREVDAELVRALARLSRNDRETLLLVAWGELSYEETAVALGVPIGTVRSRLSRARRLLDNDLSSRRADCAAKTIAGGIHG
ncbi:MAG TPA: sigma-70 family RNA polymerase sigma factor [Solirubrobacter sp.]|nr:sigma-70 family RNA polymerase sigma factor [Solirubrobacter sp.]